MKNLAIFSTASIPFIIIAFLLGRSVEACMRPSETDALIFCQPDGGFTMRGIKFIGVNTKNVNETADVIRSVLCDSKPI